MGWTLILFLRNHTICDCMISSLEQLDMDLDNIQTSGCHNLNAGLFKYTINNFKYKTS